MEKLRKKDIIFYYKFYKGVEVKLEIYQRYTTSKLNDFQKRNRYP